MTKLYAYNRGKFGQLEHINNLHRLIDTGNLSGITIGLEYLSFYTEKQLLSQLGWPIKGRIRTPDDVYPARNP